MGGYSLLGWLDDPPPDRGIRFARRDEGWEFRSYARLAGLAHRACRGLLTAGVAPGDVVALAHRAGPAFVASFFGTLLAGATPTVIGPPTVMQNPGNYGQHVGGVFAAARPALVVADADLADRVGAIASAVAGVPTVAFERLPEPPPAGPGRSPSETALVQFTSGSSGTAAGVKISARALESNLAAIGRWLRLTRDDPTASWLPVHHDMGLIGCLLTPVTHSADIWLLRPQDFIKRPVRYLRCFGVNGARLTALPSFGLRHIVRRVDPAQLAGCDFTDWRAIIVGAERIDAQALTQAYELLGPFGLSRTAFLPAYGLAEATVAVTGLELPVEWTSVRVDARSLAPGQPVRRADDAPTGHLRTGESGTGQEVVGCGRPLTGVQVRVVDDAGAPLPAGHVGQIEVRGLSVAAGYLDQAEPDRSTMLSGGILRTGDAGFLLDEQLFVLGRLGDSLKIRGRTMFAEDVETVLGALRMPPRRMVTLLGVHEGDPTAVVVFELARPEWLADAPGLLRPHLDGARVVLVDAPRGILRWTASGKPRRRPLWREFVAGRLPVAAGSNG